MEAEFEVQRTMKRAELTAFLCLLKNVIGPIKVHVDNKGIVDGLWREEGENASIRKLAMLTCGSKFGKNCTFQSQKKYLVKVEHVKAHRTKKDKKEMSHFEKKFVTEGNEKADELAKEGAMLDEGFMAETRAKTVQQEREEVYAAVQYAASFHCLFSKMEGLCRAQAEAKRKVDFRGSDKRGDETSNGVVC